MPLPYLTPPTYLASAYFIHTSSFLNCYMTSSSNTIITSQPPPLLSSICGSTICKPGSSPLSGTLALSHLPPNAPSQSILYKDMDHHDVTNVCVPSISPRQCDIMSEISGKDVRS